MEEDDVRPGTTYTPRIFVSHDHRDDTFCQRLVGDLRAYLGNDSVWYDALGGLHGGDNWWESIVREITERPFFLVVLSPHSAASGWVKQEMQIAFRQYVEQRKRLLPVRLTDGPRREDWALIQEFDFREHERPEHYIAALSALLDVLGVRADGRTADEHLIATAAQRGEEQGVINVASHSYGIRQVDISDSQERPYIRNLMFAQSPLPISATTTFHTTHGHQTQLEFSVYQSDAREEHVFDLTRCKEIARVTVGPLPAGVPRHTAIEVCLTLTETCVLRGEARRSLSDQGIEVSVAPVGLPSYDELDLARKRSALPVVVV